ncbi:hypothetical protein CDAR_262471 [Caerostris darwini]|uniref:Uncharacterized protein n=1 Tax=Caerostris darwini TaxID=1538125 RepID=A0AAV4TY67_9ARAC|nr:hypothetical protein CDAR_262471 [Caerostris darwini]
MYEERTKWEARCVNSFSSPEREVPATINELGKAESVRLYKTKLLAANFCKSLINPKTSLNSAHRRTEKATTGHCEPQFRPNHQTLIQRGPLPFSPHTHTPLPTTFFI